MTPGCWSVAGRRFSSALWPALFHIAGGRAIRMKVHEYAKQADKESKEVLAVIDELNEDLEGEARINATSPQSNLEDNDLDLLNGYFGFTPQEMADDVPPKLIPMRLYDVKGIRLKGKGPGVIREQVEANDESEANRQVIVKRGIKGTAYKFTTRKVRDLGMYYRPNPKAPLRKATDDVLRAAEQPTTAAT